MRHRRNGLALPLIIINICANPAVLGKVFPLFFASVSLTLMDDFCLLKQRPKKVYAVCLQAPDTSPDPVLGLSFAPCYRQLLL